VGEWVEPVKPLLRTWLDRVEASEIERGKILQLQTCIFPRACGYEAAGRKTTLDYDDCDQIILALRRRIERDGGPRVTEEQAVDQRRRLAGMQHRLGLPDVDYSRIAFFLLEDFIVHDENAYRALVGPTYTAHFTDGSILRYSPMPWINGGGCTWRWVLPTWRWVLPPRRKAS
jgi:hypothetical protein